MNKGLLIDAGACTITPIQYRQGGPGLLRHLPGGLTIATVFENGDVLFVDDEGLLKPASVAFRIKSRTDGQPMMSNGVLVGRDSWDGVKEITLPPEFTPEQLLQEIEWLSVERALAWFRQRAREPAVTSTRGNGEPIVYARWGELLDNLEGRKGYRMAEDERLLKDMGPKDGV
jgi:hypothetical protein